MDEVTSQLIQRAREGDRAALEHVVLSTISGVRIFLLSIAPPGMSVDDLVQETYLTAYTRLQDFDLAGAGSSSSWLCGIGRNLLKRELRSRASEARVHDQLKTAGASSTADEIAETSSDLIQERAARLQKCLEKLSPQHRELVALRYGRQLPYEDVAELLRRPSGWARTTLLRVRLVLRQCVEKSKDGYG